MNLFHRKKRAFFSFYCTSYQSVFYLKVSVLTDILFRSFWISLDFAHTQGEEMGDCRRHVPAYLQVGASDGAQIRWRESSLSPYWCIAFTNTQPEDHSVITFSTWAQHSVLKMIPMNRKRMFVFRISCLQFKCSDVELMCHVNSVFSCICRKTRIRRRVKTRSMAQSWRLRRTAPLQGWWTCMVGHEIFKMTNLMLIFFSLNIKQLN